MPLTAQLSFSGTLTSSWLPLRLSLPNQRQFLPAYPRSPKRGLPIIRMGGGPRTYPGGVSKWQWKRMQAKKSKQLLKARLARERQIYEMRKRAELKAAVSELERPWEPVQRSAAPNLFSVSADEQLKVLADRFQKPGGLDLWTDRDGPQLFRTPDGFPTARFFPKGVVHSVRPYGEVSSSLSDEDEGADGGVEEGAQGDSGPKRGGGEWRKRRGRGRGRINGSGPSGVQVTGELGQGQGKLRPSGDRRNYGGRNGRRVGSRPVTASGARLKFPPQGRTGFRGSRDTGPGEVYDMSLADDGSYGFEADN